jgi:uncharacterized protein YqjF (DUF2071 family)
MKYPSNLGDNSVHHRMPAGPWIMTQTWHNLLFLHAPIEPETLLPFLPPSVELDTFDGQAWLGVVAFRLSKVRLRGFPEVVLVSHFNEINLRTYVTRRGIPGVLFLSMDADNRLAITLARPMFGLPYTPADIIFERTTRGLLFSSKRTSGRGTGAQFEAEYHPQGPVYSSRCGTLEHWLTERYCYYTAIRGHTYGCDIFHPQWPLQHASASIARNTLAESLGLRAEPVEPTLHYAHKLTALIGRPQRIR